MTVVPFSDVAYSVEARIAVDKVLESGWASKGKLCDEFQAGLEKYLGSHVCLVNNGSSALMVALLANGVKAGDTVLVPDFTFVATASVPAILGCKIVPVDADPETFNINYDAMQPTTNDNYPWFLMGTDVAGLPCGIWSKGNPRPDYIQDAAEALGAETNGSRIGAEDWLTTFSFQTTKQLNTIEGGAIASRDEELIATCRQIADYGRTDTRYLHSVLGMNSRMTEVQAALGLEALGTLDTTLRRRNAIAQRYSRELRSQLRPQATPAYVSRHAWWTFLAIVLDDQRDVLLKKLNDAGVDARAPWVPIHRQPWFADTPWQEARYHWNSDDICQNGILLPIFNSMTEEQVDYVVEQCLTPRPPT